MSGYSLKLLTFQLKLIKMGLLTGSVYNYSAKERSSHAHYYSAIEEKNLVISSFYY